MHIYKKMEVAMFTLIKKVELASSHYQGLQDILICGQKIVEISPEINSDRKDLEVIDGREQLAIPGYIDQHVHVTGGGGEGGFTTRIPELGLSKCIEAGVTTLVGLLGTDATTRCVENLIAKTKGLNEEGVTAYCLTGSYDYPSPTLTGSVKKDIVFINEVIGVKLAISDHRSSYPTKEELIKLVTQSSQAALLGHKPGFVHIHMGTGKAGLQPVFDVLEETDVPIKFFRPTHVKKIVDDAVKFAKMGGYIDLTASAQSDAVVKVLFELLDKGAPRQLITVSSDSNGSSPKWNSNNEYIGIGVSKMTSMHLFTKELVQKHGYTWEEALEFTTVNPAKALELYPVKGVIQTGSDADLLLLDQKGDIDTVVAKGKAMMLNGEILVKGVFEDA